MAMGSSRQTGRRPRNAPADPSQGTGIAPAVGAPAYPREAGAEARLHAQARQNQAIATLGQVALASDLPDLMNRTVRLLATTLGCEHAAVLELEPGGQSFLMRAGVGWADAAIGHARI